MFLPPDTGVARMQPTDSLQSELQTTKDNLETAEASCADLSAAKDTLTSDKSQLQSQVDLLSQQATELKTRTPCSLLLGASAFVADR
jgi:predicted  nucleic acid-binding Zn-ribbon protein